MQHRHAPHNIIKHTHAKILEVNLKAKYHELTFRLKLFIINVIWHTHQYRVSDTITHVTLITINNVLGI